MEKQSFIINWLYQDIINKNLGFQRDRWTKRKNLVDDVDDKILLKEIIIETYKGLL